MRYFCRLSLYLVSIRSQSLGGCSLSTHQCNSAARMPLSSALRSVTGAGRLQPTASRTDASRSRTSVPQSARDLYYECARCDHLSWRAGWVHRPPLKADLCRACHSPAVTNRIPPVTARAPGLAYSAWCIGKRVDAAPIRTAADRRASRDQSDRRASRDRACRVCTSCTRSLMLQQARSSLHSCCVMQGTCR
jgi:hypothetical protein